MRPVIFISRSRKDLLSLPKLAREEIGFALYDVQRGVFPHFAEPLHGLGSGVFEIAIELEQGAFRAAYVVRLRNAIYVLHVFQKKSKRGIETAKADIALIRERLKNAEEIDQAH